MLKSLTAALHCLAFQMMWLVAYKLKYLDGRLFCRTGGGKQLRGYQLMLVYLENGGDGVGGNRC